MTASQAAPLPFTPHRMHPEAMRSNFAFLRPHWPDLFDEARCAEREARLNPARACREARYALERVVCALTDYERDSVHLADAKLLDLIGMLTRDGTLGPRAVLAHRIRKYGNRGSHAWLPDPTTAEAERAVRDLHRLLSWYALKQALTQGPIPDFDPSLLASTPTEPPVGRRSSLRRLVAASGMKRDNLLGLIRDQQLPDADRAEAMALLLEALTEDAMRVRGYHAPLTDA